MKIEKGSDRNVYIVSLHGKLISQGEVEELMSQFRSFRENNVINIILNLEELDWMGSMGLGALISCMTSLRNVGGDLRLANANAKLTSLLKMTRVDSVFQIFENVDMAVLSFTAASN